MRVFEVLFYYPNNVLGYGSISSAIIYHNSEEQLNDLIKNYSSIFIDFVNLSNLIRPDSFSGYNIDNNTEFVISKVGDIGDRPLIMECKVLSVIAKLWDDKN